VRLDDASFTYLHQQNYFQQVVVPAFIAAVTGSI
jgi:hypothetical protein